MARSISSLSAANAADSRRSACSGIVGIEVLEHERAVRCLRELRHMQLCRRQRGGGFPQTCNALLEARECRLEVEVLPLELGDDGLEARQPLLGRHGEAASPSRTARETASTAPSRSCRTNSPSGVKSEAEASVCPWTSRATPYPRCRIASGLRALRRPAAADIRCLFCTTRTCTAANIRRESCNARDRTSRSCALTASGIPRRKPANSQSAPARDSNAARCAPSAPGDEGNAPRMPRQPALPRGIEEAVRREPPARRLERLLS